MVEHVAHVEHIEHFPGLHEHGKTDIASVLVMSLGAVATAWCAYQSSVWAGAQARHYVLSGKFREQAAQAHLEGNQDRMIDASMFMSFATSYASHQPELMMFIHERFRPEMRVAVDAWLETRPLENPNAPKHPLAMKEYVVKPWQQAEELTRAADEQIDMGVHANHFSETYVLATVLFAVVLFFAGVGPKLPRAISQRIAFGFSALLLVGTLLWIATLPVAFGH